MKYNELAARHHAAMVKKGFWDQPISTDHSLCLVITEIAEAIEADRKDRHADVQAYKAALEGRNLFGKKNNPTDAFEKYMKNSVEDEFADVILRLVDMAGDLQLNLDEMNPMKYNRAFGRWDFTENAFALIKGLSRENINVNRRILFGLTYVEKWANHIGFDLEYAIQEKMQYNATRASKHGKKY